MACLFYLKQIPVEQILCQDLYWIFKRPLCKDFCLTTRGHSVICFLLFPVGSVVDVLPFLLLFLGSQPLLPLTCKTLSEFFISSCPVNFSQFFLKHGEMGYKLKDLLVTKQEICVFSMFLQSFLFLKCHVTYHHSHLVCLSLLRVAMSPSKNRGSYFYTKNA